jgi:hypothetical protein
MTCPRCVELEERLRIQAASNLALVKECDFLRAKVIERGLDELADAPAMDLRLRAEITGEP